MALLDFVPDTAAIRNMIVLNDYEALRKLGGVEAPKDAAAVAEYRRKVLGSERAVMPSHFSGLGPDFDPDVWLKQLGFTRARSTLICSSGSRRATSKLCADGSMRTLSTRQSIKTPRRCVLR